MVTLLARIIKYGFQNFFRNGWLSTATIAIMVLTLFVVHSVVIFGVVMQTALVTIQDKIDVSVYFKTESPEEEVLAIKSSLEKLGEVREVEYISRDNALEKFRNNHASEDTISQALAELGENPLGASLNIKAHDPREYAAIAAYLGNQTLSNFIDKVNYAQNASVIDRLVRIIDTVKGGGMILALVLAGIAILVSFNTIRLAIYSNREEIGIMRLVGASNSFISGPYIIEGIMYGLAAAVISLGIAAPLINLSAPYVNVFIPEVNLSTYFVQNFWNLFGIQVMVGVGLGIVSSSFAVRRYLRK